MTRERISLIEECCSNHETTPNPAWIEVEGVSLPWFAIFCSNSLLHWHVIRGYLVASSTIFLLLEYHPYLQLEIAIITLFSHSVITLFLGLVQILPVPS